MTKEERENEETEAYVPDKAGRSGNSYPGYPGQPLVGRTGYGEGGYYNTRGAWTTTGPYTGRGPRGYQRSDERIIADVCERLTRHGYIDARGIKVDAEAGEIILKGIVDSRNAKRLAEETAESVPGVRDVHNQLRIRRLARLRTRGRNAIA